MAAPNSLLKGFAKTVANLKPHPSKRIAVSDPDTRGLYVRITPKGVKTYTVVAQDPFGKQKWAAVGEVDSMPLETARELARQGVRRIKAGEEPFPKDAPPETFETVAKNFTERYIDKNEFRSAPEMKRILDKYILPEWKSRAFLSIKRSDVTRLMDRIEDKNGPVQADRVLALLSKLFVWQAGREDEYNSPIIRGMRRTKASERARERFLNDDEIRALWKAAGDSGTYGAFVKMLLLTGQRRAKVLKLQWGDISDQGVWVISPDERIEVDDKDKEKNRKRAAEKREKSNGGTLRLPQLAQDVLASIARVEGNPHVFAGRGKTILAASTKLKNEIDEKAGFSDWTLHDLRRTAKTLMRRAGVDSDISERVLGHVIVGVEGVYDKHDYKAEKATALEKLASQIDLILNPPADNVVPIKGAV